MQPASSGLSNRGVMMRMSHAAGQADSLHLSVRVCVCVLQGLAASLLHSVGS